MTTAHPRKARPTAGLLALVLAGTAWPAAPLRAQVLSDEPDPELRSTLESRTDPTRPVIERDPLSTRDPTSRGPAIPTPGVATPSAPNPSAGTTGFDSTNTRRRPSAVAPTRPGQPATLPPAVRARAGTAAPPTPTGPAPIGTTTPQSRAPGTLTRLPQPRPGELPSLPTITSTPTPAAAPPPGLPAPPDPAARRRRPAAEADPFEPIGLRAGVFDVFPTVEIAGGYDSNPARASRGRGSTFVVVTPELRARSNWTRHELGFTLRGSYTDFLGIEGLDRPTLDARTTLRLDAFETTRIELEAGYGLATENPGDPNLPGRVATLPLISTATASGALIQRFNRFELRLGGTVERQDYEDARLASGATVNNADRNATTLGATLRGTYRWTEALAPFVEAGVDRTRFDRRLDDDGFARASTGTTVRAGTTFEFTRLLTGEISAGLTERRYDDARLGTLRGPLFDAALVWTASPLTTIRFEARTTIGDSTLTGVSGVIERDIAVQVDHSFRRWLTATARLGFGSDIYEGSTREDERLTASAALTWKLSPIFQLRGEFRHERLTSSVPGQDYTANIATLGLRLQR